MTDTDYAHPFNDPSIPANPRVRVFDSRCDAYDAVQCDETIADGDILYIPAHRVIAIATRAWPCAYTPLPPGTEADDLHQLLPDITWEAFAHGRYMTAVTRIRKPSEEDLAAYTHGLGRRWEGNAEPLAYQYKSDTYCTDCVRAVARLVPNGTGDLRHHHYQAWHYEAALRGIDLADESSYDSDDYPKPITASSELWEEPDAEQDTYARVRTCRHCGGPLTLNGSPY